MRIIGIDPGSRATGYGVVDGRTGRIAHVAHGVVRTPRSASLAARLAMIHRELSAVVALHAPDLAVVERVFVAADPRAAIVLGEARGAALAALAGAGLPVEELSAREVKRSVTGGGSACKADVQRMVVRLLALDAVPPADAADALAVAISRASVGRLAGLTLGRRSSRRRTLASVAALAGVRA